MRNGQESAEKRWEVLRTVAPLSVTPLPLSKCGCSCGGLRVRLAVARRVGGHACVYAFVGVWVHASMRACVRVPVHPIEWYSVPMEHDVLETYS